MWTWKEKIILQSIEEYEIEWRITTTSVHDKNIAFPIIDSVSNYNYILMDAAYDSSDI